MMYTYGYDGFFPFHMFGFGFLFIIVFWALVIYGLVWLFRKGSTEGESPKKGAALEILRERYVKGEITKHQFEEMKKDIGH